MYSIDFIETPDSINSVESVVPDYHHPILPERVSEAVRPLSNDMVSELLSIFDNEDLERAEPSIELSSEQMLHNHKYNVIYNPPRRVRVPHKRVLKFSYGYDALYEEVYKRTSFISKNRGTDVLAHQLSQMSFTRDEDFMFKPFIKEAASNIYEKLYPFSKDIEKAFRFIDSVRTVELPKLPDITNHADIDDGSELSSVLLRHDDAVGSWYTLSGLTNVDIHTPIDYKKFGIKIVVRFTYSVLCGNRRVVRSEYLESIVSAKVSKPATWSATVFVAEGVYGKDIERFGQVLSLDVVESKIVRKGVPDKINKGDYVELSGEDDVELYKALEDTDSNGDILNPYLFEKQDIDERNSVVYRLNILEWMDDNAFSITDNAIFEAIVNFVIYRWFLIVNPSESSIYYSFYDDYLTRIIHRINAQKKPVRRTYHLF